MKMNRFINARREVRKRITSNKKYDGVLHKFIIIVLLVNTILILYVMLAVTLNMTLSGVSLIDSIPIALYILPFMVFLPLMILAYHRDRSAAWNFPFLIICTIFFGMLSLLIHGFLICLV
ncbi:MAG: hypothetical protein ACFFDV_08325, partial [Candidatus Thorarchaeota archaeon]